MTVTLEARMPCTVCGYRLRVIITGSARVNKRSLRLSHTLSASDRECPECGEPVWQIAWDRARLRPEDAAKVEAYRLRKWPELAREAARGKVA